MKPVLLILVGLIGNSLGLAEPRSVATSGWRNLDLDGGFGTEQCPSDLHSINDLHKLEGIMDARGYSAEDIDGVFFGNWLRFFRESLPKG